MCKRGVHFLLVFIFAVLSSQSAFSCAPPVFPLPESVASLYQKQADEGVLDEMDQIYLDEYEADRDKHAEDFNRLYPCPMYEIEIMEIPWAEKVALEEELIMLEWKWSEDDVFLIEEEEIQPVEPTYYDFDAESEMIHLE